MRRSTALLPLFVLACADGGEGPSSDTDASLGPQLDCPDLSEPGLNTVTSADVERAFALWYPKKADTRGMPVVFVWHGLTPGGEPGDVAQDMSEALDLRAWAREAQAIVVVPEALPQDLVGQSVLLWGILADDAAALDLAFYDDLRGCVAQELGGDPDRVSSFGFSGGALWNSILLGQRADTFSAVVSASGGTGQGFDTLDYEQPSAPVPVLLTDGGTNDVWPGGGLTVIDFHEGTEDLRSNLVEDGHVVARCGHTMGHTIPADLWFEAQDWLLGHVRGETSPYASGGASLAAASCELWVDGALRP